MRWTPTLAILLTTSLLTTVAAEPSEASVPGIETTYFLNSDGQNVTLTTLPPSAMNRSTHDIPFRGSYSYGWPSDEPESFDILLPMPVPGLGVVEDAGFQGNVTLSYSCDAGTGSYCGGLTAEVLLLEGARESAASRQQSVYSSPRTLEFGGQFPGHGEDARPHTHGDGTDASRGLQTEDLSLVLRVTESSSMLTVGNLWSNRYTVHLQVDGSGFVSMVLLPPQAPASAPPEPVLEQQVEPQPAEEPANGTSGNGSAHEQSSGASYGPAGTVEPSEGGDSPGLGLLGIAAAAGAVVRRRRA